MGGDDVMKFVYITACSLITFISIFILIIYWANKKFKSIPCYFIIFFCFVNSIYNIVRIIPYFIEKEIINSNDKNICKLQAILLNALNKYLLTLMTIYSLINYISQFHVKLYQKNMKIIFIGLIILGFIISLVFSIIFYFKSDINAIYENICYIEKDDILKKICDNIYSSILFITNMFCLIKLIINMNKLIEESINNLNVQKELACKMHLKRFIIDIVINISIFAYVFFIINKNIAKEQYPDLIYIILFFGIELFFTMNKQLFKVIINIIICRKTKNENSSQRTTEEGFSYSIIEDALENEN